jgi:UDP-N-acetylglucosamine--N-acetylmuramyl-(pentapeptide) pyrophosphoryl-undecaprenol N-acetylglucosamine transferase
MTRFAFAAAGTGGHVYPALAVGAALVARGVERDDIVFFGGTRLAATAVPAAGFPFVAVPLQGLQRRFTAANLKLPVVVLRATRRIAAELRRRRTRVMLATGGYVTVPAALAARRTRVRLFLQEQNAEPGLANRFAARWASEVFLGLPAAAGKLPGEVTGNPLRRELVEFDRATLRGPARAHYGLPGDATVVGVLGGSLGSAVINEAVADYARRFGAPGVALLHLAGPGQAAEMERLASSSGLPWRVVPFDERMELFYGAVDLAICRAGGLTVSELAATGTPSILVPRASGAAGHQDRNAEHLRAGHAALVVAEEDAADLPRFIADLVADPERRRAMRGAALTLARRRAAARIAAAMLEAADG